MESFQEEIKEREPVAKLDLRSLEDQTLVARGRRNEAARLNKYVDETDKRVTKIGQHQQRIDLLEEPLQRLGDSFAILAEAGVKSADLIKLVGQISAYTYDLKARGKELERLEADFHELMPDECPLCGRSCDCNA
jgi:hypothetical protein